MRIRVITKCIAVVVAFLSLATASLGQETTGSIVGTARDATGGAVPGVAMKATNINTGLVRTTTTDSVGDYVLTGLPIGEYQLEAQRSGFKTSYRKGLVLHVNDRLDIDVVLEVGQVVQEVSVSGAAPVVQTESSEVSGLADQNTVRELPLNGRSFLQLTTLFPGAVSGAAGQGYGPAAFSDPTNPYFGKQAIVSVNGARGQQTNWVIDGGSNVDPGANWSVNNLPSPDNIAEFRILESDYTAEFGRNAGGQVNIITKSGGATYHGTLLEFFRNDVLDSRSYFATTKGPLRFNQFGFNFGGPLIPRRGWVDKLDFFTSTEWVRMRTSTPFVGTTIPAAERKGDFSDLLSETPPVQLVNPATGTPLPGNQIPSAALDPNAKLLASLYPLPTTSGRAENYVTNITGSRDSVQQLYRLDYKPTNKVSLTARWMRDGVTMYGENGAFSGGGLPVNGTNLFWPGENLVASLSQVINPHLLHEFQFSRTYDRLNNVPTGTYLRSQVPGLSIPEIYPLSDKTNSFGNLPEINISGFSSIDNVAGLPYRNYADAIQFDDKVTYVRGDHTLKAGFHYLYGRKREGEVLAPEEGLFNFTGFATHDPVADFMIGQAYTYEEENTLLWGEGRYQDIEAFVQDHMKVGRHLSLDIGTRLELFPEPYEAQNRYWNFLPQLFNPAEEPTVYPNGFILNPSSGDLYNGIVKAPYNGSRSIIENHYDTWSPRFGFAWSPSDDGKTVIRGGYGLFFDRGTLIAQFGYANAQTVGVVFIPPLSNPGGGMSLTLPRIVVANDYTGKIGSVQQWSMGVQREVLPQTVLEVRYVGAPGHHLQNTVDLNQPYPNTEVPEGLAAADYVRPYTGLGEIGFIRDNGNSIYHSLQVSASRRMSKGLQFQLSYTYAKTIDDCPFHPNIVNGVQDMRNPKGERALSDVNVPQNFVYSYVWTIPYPSSKPGPLPKILGGWQMSGIVTFQAGQPFNVTLTKEVSGTASLERPNMTGNPNLASGTRTVQEYFDTSAFSLPADGTFGSAPRNAVQGPGINNWDWALQKNAQVPWLGGKYLEEKATIQFRFEVFDMWNHPQFWGINTQYAAPAFGMVDAARTPRQIQFGLKPLW